MLQHTTTHCNTLQHIADIHTHQLTTPYPDSTLQKHTATTHCNNSPQHTAAHCSTLQHAADILTRQLSAPYPNSTLQQLNSLQQLNIHNNALQQRTATTHCNTFSHVNSLLNIQNPVAINLILQIIQSANTTTHCNTLQQHTATHCNTPQQHTAAMHYSTSNIQLILKSQIYRNTASTHCTTISTCHRAHNPETASQHTTSDSKRWSKISQKSALQSFYIII